MVIIRSIGSDGSQGLAMAAKSLSSVMKVSKMEYCFCSDLQWPTLSWQIVEMHEMVPQEWFERSWHCQLLWNVVSSHTISIR
jgi:hypothetical protein